MANYQNLSRYYMDDKDVVDLISGGEVSTRFMLGFLRRRGIFLPEPSKNWPREELVKLFARQLFSWKEIREITEETNTTDREDRTETCKMTGIPTTFDVAAILNDLQALRASSKNEAYQLSKKADGTTQVLVAYTEIDPYLARPFQKRAKVLELEVQLVGSELEVSYSSNPRASQIVEVLTGLICLKDPETIEATRIEFPGLKDAALRTEFFSQLLEKVSGFRILDVQDVKVDNRLDAEKAPEDDEGEDEDSDADEPDEKASEVQAQVVKGLIKKAAFSGNSVLTSEIYQQLRQSGYFISSLNWKALELSADHEVEFRAEMADPVRFGDFRFDVTKVTTLGSDPDEFKKAMHDVRRNYIKRLREAAFTSKKIVEDKIHATGETTKNGTA